MGYCVAIGNKEYSPLPKNAAHGDVASGLENASHFNKIRFSLEGSETVSLRVKRNGFLS